MSRSHARPLLVLSALALVLVCSYKKNHPPQVPVKPEGTSLAVVGDTVRFVTMTTDPDGDNVSYQFSWGRGTNDTTSWGDPAPSGDSASCLATWSTAGTYPVKARARDRREATSSWSPELAVVIMPGHSPDTLSAPSGPDFGYRGQYCSFYVSTHDPDGDSISYQFNWGRGANDTTPWSDPVPSGDGCRDSVAWSAVGTYLVRARARDTKGVATAWSTPCTTVIDTVRMKWCYGAECFESSPAVGSDGTVYVGSSYDRLYAIKPDGTLKWSYRTEGGITSSPAIAADGTVYVGDKYLWAINPDGTFKWRYDTLGWVESSPAIGADGTIYVGSDDNCLYAIKPTGILKWRYQTGGDVFSSPAVGSDGTVYVGSADNCLYAVNPDGTLKWRYQTQRPIWSSPSINSDGTVYVGSDDNYLYAIDPGGTLKWRYQTGYDVFSSPAIGSDGTIYIGSDDKYLHAINPDGTLKWCYKTTWGCVYSSPAVGSDGTIYVGAEDGYLYAIDPNGALLWHWLTEGQVASSPAIGPDGTIYFGSDDGGLYALASRGTLANSPWPKFHHDLRNTGRVGGGQ